MIPGLQHFPREDDAKYTLIFIGVAWPAVRPGFLVVVGEHRDTQILGRPQLVVLDEDSDDKLWRLVDVLAALRSYYHPERVLGDGQHVAALTFVAQYAGQGLVLEQSLLCAMPGPLAYALPVLARLLDTGRLVVPGASSLRGELLTAPAHEDLAGLKLEDYPGVAALAHAVLALDSTRDDNYLRRPDRIEWTGRILG